MDLSFLNLSFIHFLCLYFVEKLILIKFKIHFKILLILISPFTLFFIYLSKIIAFFSFFLLLIAFFYFANKKKLFKCFLLYMFCYCFLCFILSRISSYIKVIYMVPVITSPRGLLGVLFEPFLFIGIYVSTIFVDYVYRLHNYKTYCYIQTNGKKVSYSGYFDTGNTSKHLGYPIIFINQKNWKISNKETIEISSINGTSFYDAEKVLVTLEDSKESMICYLALVNNNQFHDCDVLLNAYLK
ncbi:MAG: hypothetical protein PUA56_00200 [Bacillales bacterium]|nr:hypothetical protein [Bacillales bacterium]